MSELTKLMWSKKLTQEAVAEELGISQAHVSRMLAGKRKLSKARRSILVEQWGWMERLLPKGE